MSESNTTPNPLLSRIKRTQGVQRKVLMAQRKRVEDAEQERAAVAQGADVTKTLVAPIRYGSDSGGQLINADVLFNELIGPVGMHMGCAQEDLAWMRENWGQGPELFPTLVDWSTKVILYAETIDVSDELRGVCMRVMQSGSSALTLTPDAQDAAATKEMDTTRKTAEVQDLDADAVTDEQLLEISRSMRVV